MHLLHLSLLEVTTVASGAQERLVGLARGGYAGDIRALLHAWLVAHPSVELLTRVDSVELEGTELARVEVTVGMIGREAKGESDWDLAADVERLELRLARDGGDWRVVSATQR